MKILIKIFNQDCVMQDSSLWRTQNKNNCKEPQINQFIRTILSTI